MQKGKRELADWIEAYKEYVIPMSEAPEDFHEWVAVSMLAAATRRNVWIDMQIFDWVTNLYIVFVGPPGVVTKSTTINIGTQFLRGVQNIKLGQSSSSWQKLLVELEKSQTTVSYKDPQGKDHKLMTCPLTLTISELGTFIKTQDGGMIDALTHLWDGQKDVFEHGTKSSSDTRVENPWLNIIGGTTPDWLANNFTGTMIGGGFASRVLFIPGYEKSKFVAYPDEMQEGDNIRRLKSLLRSDLVLISALSGPMMISNEVREWGRNYYKEHWGQTNEKKNSGGQFDGYRARKWTILQKLAMIYCVSRGNDKVMRMPDVERALKLLGYAEEQMGSIFDSVTQTKESKNLALLLRHLKFHGTVDARTLLSLVKNTMSTKDFADALKLGVDSRTIIGLKKGDGQTSFTVPPKNVQEKEKPAKKRVIVPGEIPPQ